VNFVLFDEASLALIFTTVLDSHLGRFATPVRKLANPLVAGCVDLYGRIKAHLLPTPRKIHYTCVHEAKCIKPPLLGGWESWQARSSTGRL
jgi:hypothetical protein